MVNDISQLEEGLYIDEQSQEVYWITPDKEGELLIVNSGKPDRKVFDMDRDEKFLRNLRRLQTREEIGEVASFYRGQLVTIQGYIRDESEKLMKLDETIRSTPRL